MITSENLIIDIPDIASQLAIKVAIAIKLQATKTSYMVIYS